MIHTIWSVKLREFAVFMIIERHRRSNTGTQDIIIRVCKRKKKYVATMNHQDQWLTVRSSVRHRCLLRPGTIQRLRWSSLIMRILKFSKFGRCTLYAIRTMSWSVPPPLAVTFAESFKVQNGYIQCQGQPVASKTVEQWMIKHDSHEMICKTTWIRSFYDHRKTS